MAQTRNSDPQPLGDDESPARRQWLRIALLTALVLQLSWMLNVYPHWRETNSTSRVYLAVAIVEYGTFQIDQCLALYGDTLDKALYQGHYYSDKAPGTSFLFVPVTWLIAALSPADRANPDGPAMIDMRTLFYLLRILCVSLPTIAFWWLTLPWFRAWTGREDRAVAVVAAGALGTNFAIYATQLFAHVPAAWFLFLAFLSIRRLWSGTWNHPSLAPGLWGGALAGVAFLNDYVVMLAVAMLGAATLFPRPHWRQAFGFALGLAPSLAVWMLYNWICFDHPLTTGFVYHALPLYGDAYQSGFLGIQPLDPLAIPGMLFSPARGMCFLSPFLVLAPVGWWRQIRGGEFRWDAIHAALLAGSLFLFAMTTIDWRGGWGTGTRYLVPMVPFLLVGVAGALRGVRAGEPVSILFGGLAAVGVMLVAAASITVPLFPQEFDNPWVSLVGQLLGQGYLAPHLGTSAAGAWGGLAPYLLGVLLTLLLVTTSGPAPNVGVTAAVATLSLSLALIIIGWQATIPEPPGRQLVRDITRAECLMRLGFFEQAAREMLALQETPPPPPSNAAPGGSTRSKP